MLLLRLGIYDAKTDEIFAESLTPRDWLGIARMCEDSQRIRGVLSRPSSLAKT